MKLSSPLLLALLPLLQLIAAEPKVDRLISKRYLDSLEEENVLERRDAGFANGGKAGQNGRGPDGKLRNKGNFEISFYHTNDVHAHLDQFRSSGQSCTDPSRGCVGGYSRIKTVIDRSRPTKKNSLFLNAGDEFQGTLFYTLFKGWKIAETLNQLGFDAMTLGNHEFDDGDDLVADFIQNLTFPVISSNIHTKHRKLARGLVPFHIFKKHNLAVIAVTTETTAQISSPSNLTTFEDPIAAAKRTVKFLGRHHPSVKRIVALTHIGYDRDIELARATTGISLIIGGHSHTPLGDIPNSAGAYPTITTNPLGEEVFVVTSYRWGEYLGYIDVEYDKRGRIVSYEGAPIHLTNQTAEEPKLKSQISEWAKSFDAYSRTTLGTTVNPLVQSTCQVEECTLGSFTADGMEDSSPSGSALAGAIINAGGIRAEIDAGDITLQQALECFPFGNSLVELTFTGSELWDIFESIVSKISVFNQQTVTSFVQISRSIRFTYNPSNPVGSRLTTLTIKGQPVNAQESYRIATLDYLAGGGDNFWPKRSDFVSLGTMDEVWAKYVTAKSPIDFRADGRISTTSETAPQKPT